MEKGHISSWCPQVTRGRAASDGDIDRRKGPGTGRGNDRPLGNDGEVDRRRGEGQFSAHYLSTQACGEKGRCKRIVTREERCPACHQVTRAVEKLCHCVFHCGAYKRAGLEQKIKIVRDGQLCVVCLSDNHHSSGCENKSSVCGLERFKKRHHPDLYGSTDP